MEISNELLNGEKIIYIANRLFNIQDKMAENKLGQKVYRYEWTLYTFSTPK